MPISPENKALYPADWPAIRAAILTRAGHKCEECGVPNRARIVRRKADPFIWAIEADMLLDEFSDPDWEEWHDPVEIVLTCAHLNHNPETRDPALIRALCQRCHLQLDTKEHARSRRENRHRRAGQLTLVDGGQPSPSSPRSCGTARVRKDRSSRK